MLTARTVTDKGGKLLKAGSAAEGQVMVRQVVIHRCTILRRQCGEDLIASRRERPAVDKDWRLNSWRERRERRTSIVSTMQVATTGSIGRRNRLFGSCIRGLRDRLPRFASLRASSHHGDLISAFDTHVEASRATRSFSAAFNLSRPVRKQMAGDMEG